MSYYYIVLYIIDMIFIKVTECITVYHYFSGGEAHFHKAGKNCIFHSHLYIHM